MAVWNYDSAGVQYDSVGFTYDGGSPVPPTPSVTGGSIGGGVGIDWKDLKPRPKVRQKPRRKRLSTSASVGPAALSLTLAFGRVEALGGGVAEVTAPARLALAAPSPRARGGAVAEAGGVELPWGLNYRDRQARRREAEELWLLSLE